MKEIAFVLEKTYFSPLETSPHRSLTPAQLGASVLFAVDCNRPEFQQYGIDIFCEISFKDPRLSNLFLSDELASLYCSYYQRQPYFRNQPVLQRLDYRGGSQAGAGNVYHTDWFGQLSGMLLVSDVTSQDTHMEYARGSHRYPWWRIGSRAPKASVIPPPKAEILVKCTGSSGTLYLFDAGGIHRRCLRHRRPRKMLHFNITGGSHLRPFREAREPWPALRSARAHVRHMFDVLDVKRN